MIKVKQLYVLWESDFCDKKLIPKEDYKEFKSKLKTAEKNFDNYIMLTPFEDQDEDLIEELKCEIYDLIDEYDTLEGEEVFIVLPEDVIDQKLIKFEDLHNINSDEQIFVYYGNTYCGRGKKGVLLNKTQVEDIIINNGFYSAEVRCNFNNRVLIEVKKCV